jgi:hypothetical protein
VFRKGRTKQRYTHAALCPSGTLASTALISAGPNPVAVLLCFGLLMPGGPTAVVKSLIGAEVLGLRSRGAGAVVAEAMFVVRVREGGRESVVNKRGREQFSSCKVNTQ